MFDTPQQQPIPPMAFGDTSAGVPGAGTMLGAIPNAGGSGADKPPGPTPPPPPPLFGAGATQGKRPQKKSQNSFLGTGGTDSFRPTPANLGYNTLLGQA